MKIFLITLSILLSFLSCFAQQATGQDKPKATFEQYLRESTVPKQKIERFLCGPSWGRFDSELGYALGAYLRPDGLDGSSSISTAPANGPRTSYLYADKKCRINVYGDSFTSSEQVNDGETWEEYLAAHLVEPIRNFGVGGYGVYQAYRRMLREERTDHGAEYVILYIWGDDHIRSLYRCRHAAIYKGWNPSNGALFHANFWAHLEMDLTTGNFVEKENELPTEESLYKMADPQFMVDHLKDDLALQLIAFSEGNIDKLDRTRVDKLASHLGFTIDWGKESTLRKQAGELLDRYSLSATRWILGKAKDFTREKGKKLLVVLFDPYRAMQEMRTTGKRYDQEVVDYLVKEKFDYFDMNEVHLRDYKKYNLSFDEYMKEYFIGHYSPAGNHFFAFSIKDKIVNWLDPKPITYQKLDPEKVDFHGYLKGYH
jgi:hypothetical protein